MYMFSYLDIITTVSFYYAVRAGTEECLEKRQELQDYIKDQNMGLYRKLRRSLFGRVSTFRKRWKEDVRAAYRSARSSMDLTRNKKKQPRNFRAAFL